MITIHTPIISTADPDLTKFLHYIAKNKFDKEGYVVAFKDYEPLYIRKFKEFEIDLTNETEDPFCYDFLTGMTGAD